MDGLDMYELSDTPENARIAMWQTLTKAGWAYSEREEALISLASGCYWAKETPNIIEISKRISP